MITKQILKREFYGKEVRQDHQSGYFCANDLTIIGNLYRKSLGLPGKKWVRYVELNSTKEFIVSLAKKEQVIDAISEKRKSKGEGKGKNNWVHPLVFFDYAMWLSSDFKVDVYRWLYDNLTVFRDESYKEMSRVLFETQGYTPSKGAMVVRDLARAIKRDLECDDWNTATPDILKKRNVIHKNVIMLLKAGVEPVRAYHIAIEEVN